MMLPPSNNLKSISNLILIHILIKFQMRSYHISQNSPPQSPFDIIPQINTTLIILHLLSSLTLQSNLTKLQLYYHMQKRIQQQTKTIQFIKNKYKEKTGEEIVLPKSWEEYLSLEENQTPIIPLPQSFNDKKPELTFMLAIDELSLPTRLNYNKVPFTSFNPSNKFHMIEIIDLSNFKDKGFTKNTLRQFLSRISDMRCLKMINLKNNGIGQQCAEEIESLLSMKRISRVDLSKNMMGKTCLQIISRSFNHIEWIDLSRNQFLFEKVALQALLNAVRVNPKLYHMQMDWQDEKMIITFCSYMKIKPQLRSLGPVDSKISQEAMDYICEILQIKESKKDNYRIFNLNFDFCYLQKPIFSKLIKAIELNNSLIKLCLSNNHLGNDQAINLLKTISSNLTIVDLNLSANLLQDQFAFALAQCLARNQILEVVSIGKNNIGIEGGKGILKAVGEDNDTLESLGDFESNNRIGPELTQKIKRALRINKVSKEVRSKILSEDSQLSTAEIASRQTEAFLQSQYRDYPLLQPLSVTNPVKSDPFKLNLWKFQ